MVTIIALGNPGAEYEKSRHNTGVMALEALFDKLGKKATWSEWKENKAKRALVRTGEYNGVDYSVIRPTVFMNQSGLTAKEFATNPKKIKELIVVHDEIDLPVGKMRISQGRSAGGHRGVESVIKHLKSNEFIRIRIGAAKATASGKAKKPDSDGTVDFVLSTFTPMEKLKLNECLKKAADAIVTIAEEGIEMAMNRYN
jgi:PTH1 family peptidyl-tRNA hydrolase